MVPSRDAMRHLTALVVCLLLLLRAKVSDDGPYTLGEDVSGKTQSARFDLMLEKAYAKWLGLLRIFMLLFSSKEICPGYEK